MIPVLAPQTPIGSASAPNAGGIAPASAPGDGSEGGVFVELLSLLIATATTPNAPASLPLIVALPDRAENLVGAVPVQPAENEEAPSLPSGDDNTLVALQIFLAAMTSPTPNAAVPAPPTGAASGGSTEANGVARAMTGPVTAAVTLAGGSDSNAPLPSDIHTSGHSPLEAVPAATAPPPGGEFLTTSPSTSAIQFTAPAGPVFPTPGVPVPMATTDPSGETDSVEVTPSAETLAPTPGVPLLRATTDLSGGRDNVELTSPAETLAPTLGVPLPLATNEAGGARDVVKVTSTTELPDRGRTPIGFVTPDKALPREAAPRGGPEASAPLENLATNRRGDVVWTMSAPLYRPDDRGASGRTSPAEGQGGSSSAPLSAASSGIPLPAVEQQGPPREFMRDQGESDRAPTPARPEAPRGVEHVEGAVTTRSTTAARDTATGASARDEFPQMNVERVVSAARASFTRGGMEVRLHLHPESLGEVRVQVRWESGTLSARLEAATPAARDALESGAPALRATLQEHGIPIERLSVNVRMDGEARSQHRPHASESPGRDEPPRDRAGETEPKPIPEPGAIGRVDIRI